MLVQQTLEPGTTTAREATPPYVTPPDVFAVQVEDDSMLDIFQIGDRVVLDRRIVDYRAGDVVLLEANGELMLRLYRPRGGRIFEAVPYNTAWATLRNDIDSLNVIATMVEHHRFRRA